MTEKDKERERDWEKSFIRKRSGRAGSGIYYMKNVSRPGSLSTRESTTAIRDPNSSTGSAIVSVITRKYFLTLPIARQ